ncbi:MAG: hypothetical protein A3H69_00500 [Candidatus Sungbacteria bacterium RIFCSPLOWO2_02_FULL_47_9]|uniref:Glycerophosphoryl diester phosphodiesterase membrane domain-containing protein n=2 Tax=Parcubacteria group TaxID=1794811 RepID=A0A1G2RRF6_9BACT|nr:MAG: hypothetical protein UX72_C0003G0008 [Parcubacteria group bacterium GW2011_GWA2_47_10]OGZ93944.1 MAG: hypothetical protein A2633_00685 [Candidatus Sungbacteria bacterium RIFCSPHIGHO2_01_FULL_47_32]OHA11458.1 MAG: hypothetical protein A3H69_00500 [Candidatus Sungbacteria bacterium RIFCSPLOWO2_02_FULL_47_9]OHA74939.1 MAG: hypothetical protein A3A32_03780 [Candidatus Wildermuthbacteria bacterium RIFCSPLOWO2_01_FULL_48_35]
MDKFNESKKIFAESVGILRKNKKILFFPILSVASSVVFFIFFIVLVFLFRLKKLDFMTSGAVSFFLLHLSLGFIWAFFQAGIVASVDASIRGITALFRDCLSRAFRNILKIFLWTLLSSIVVFVFSIVLQHSSLAVKIGIYPASVLWGLATAFIIPVLILENNSLWGSLKKSALSFRRVWVETFFVSIAAGIPFMFFIALEGALFFAFFRLNLGLLPLVFLGVFLAVLLFFAAIVFASLVAILRTVLYMHANALRQAEANPAAE